MTGPSTEKLCWGVNRLDLRHHDYRVLGVFIIHRQNKGKAASLRGLSRGLWSCGLPEQGKCRSLAYCSPGAGQCYTASQLRPRGALAIPLALRPSHGCALMKSAVTPGLHSLLGSPSRTHFVIPYLFHIVTVNLMSTPLRFFLQNRP